MQRPYLLPLLGGVRGGSPTQDTGRKVFEKWYYIVGGDGESGRIDIFAICRDWIGFLIIN